MSWDVMKDYEKPCPCGKGKVHIVEEMDDWNRIRESEEIICDECQKELIKNKQSEENEYRKYNKLSNDVIVYFKENYLTELMKCFEQAKSKKNIWEIMNKVGIERRTLQSFYYHNKNFNKQKYIEKIISIRNISKLMNLLNINDEKLNQMLQEPFEIYTKMEAKSYNEAYMRYRNK